MSLRAKVWSIGLAVIGLLLAVSWYRGASNELAMSLAFVIIAIIALIAELGAVCFSGSSRNQRPIPAGARPADGIIEILPIAGVNGVPCSTRPELRRFTGITGEESATPNPIARPKTDPPLLGKVALVSVFVGRNGVGWSESEIAAALDAIERTGRWIEREASRSGAPVNLGLADCYFQVEDSEEELVEVAFQGEGDDVGPLELHATTKAVALASRAASTLGFADAAEWMSLIDARIDADAVAWLFLIREAGRSMAITTAEAVLEGVRFAFCYAREASFPEPLKGRAKVDPSTVAHELLHLFGASDKYGVDLGLFPPGYVTSREIMRLDHDSLFRMRIDRLTAREIGWGQFLQPQQKQENPTSNRFRSDVGRLG